MRRCLGGWLEGSLAVGLGTLLIACDDPPQTFAIQEDRCPAPPLDPHIQATQSVATLPANPVPLPAPQPSPLDECLDVLGRAGHSIFTPEQAALRLAKVLWNTDTTTLVDTLGELPLPPNDRLAYATQASRAPQARAGYRAWAQWWLRVGSIPEGPDTALPTDAGAADAGANGVDPEADVTVALREGLLRFIEDVIVNDGSVSTVLTSHQLFVNATLGPFYGVDWSIIQANEPWLKLDVGLHYGGLLTQGWMLRTHTTPSRRGWFVIEALMGIVPPLYPHDPPFAVPDPLPGETSRQVWETVTASEASCAACHQIVDNPGFTFSHYDALGQYQDTEAGNPIDSTSQVTINGSQEYVDGADQYAQRLAEDPRVLRTLARSMFDYIEVTEPLQAATDSLRTCHDALHLWIDLVWLYPSAQPPPLRDLFVQITTRNWLNQPFGPYSPAPTTPSPTPTPSNPNPALPGTTGTAGTTGTNPPPSMTRCP
jgi:hypothetical protein